MSTTPSLPFCALDNRAKLPSYGSAHAAGMDIFPLTAFEIPPHSQFVASTGLSLNLASLGYPCYGRVAPRSGLAFHNSIDVLAGVVDMDYRGEVRVILFNHSDETVRIPKTKAIAQIVVERIERPDPIFVESLEDSERGSAGFGSTS